MEFNEMTVYDCEVFVPAMYWTNLHYAAFHSDLSEIDRQIQNGADIDTRAGNGETPLHISILSDSDSIKAVLKHNPSMNVSDNDRITPLIMLVICLDHKTEILRMMLEMGADPNLSNIDGNAPLHIVAKSYHEQKGRALKYTLELIKCGANVNAQNNNGHTPLHLAMMSGFTELIRLLLRKGASVEIRNSAGMNPIDFGLCFKIEHNEMFIEFGKFIIKYAIIKKLFVNQNVLNEFYELTVLKHFKDRCDQELNSNVTDGTFVTYYDLLVSPPDVVSKYLRNEGTLKFVMAFDKTKYIYGNRLAKIFRNALLRNEAVDIGYKFFEKFSPVILPDLCLDAICNHLTHEDLLKLKNFTC